MPMNPCVGRGIFAFLFTALLLGKAAIIYYPTN